MIDAIEQFIFWYLEKKGSIPGSSRGEKLNYLYIDAGHIDSFELISFILAIEDEFDIVLSPEDTQSDEFRSLGGLIYLVAQKKPAGGSFGECE